MRLAPASAALLAALALAACGESAEEKATNTVCNARAEIAKEVDALKGMTPATFTGDEASASLSAIRASLADIREAQQDLGDERRRQVEAANQAFGSEVRSVLQEVFRSTSAAEAKSQVTAAFQQLAATYESTFARVDCA
jgi:hypothetical protein